MIPIELATRIRDLVQTNVAAVAPVSAVAKDLPQTDLHEAFTAKIQQAMPDGTFKAIVAGRTLTLSLPHIAQEGDVLELVKTGHDARGTTLARIAPSGTNELQPRPQLSQAGQLISQLITGSQSNSNGLPLTPHGPLINATPGQTVSTTPNNPANPANPVAALAAQTTAPTTPQAQTALDKAAQQINQASLAAKLIPVELQTRPNPANIPAHRNAPAAYSAASITTLPAHQLATQLAPVLRQIVAQSGVFYESKLARWADGDMPIEGLLDQPQAKAARATSQSNATAQAANPNTPNAMRNAMAGTGPAIDEAQALTRHIQDDADVQNTAAARKDNASFKLPEQIMPIVNQQLDTIATQQVMWNAQVWPGQQMQWSIDDPRGQGNGEDEQAGIWRSNMRLDLPNLGVINAQLILTPAGLALRINAADPNSLIALESHQGELDESLNAAGIPLTGIALGHDQNA